jgi:hypothetical protein
VARFSSRDGVIELYLAFTRQRYGKDSREAERIRADAREAVTPCPTYLIAGGLLTDPVDDLSQVEVFRRDKNGGDERTRTADPLRAKQVLYQLSYVPEQALKLPSAWKSHLIASQALEFQARTLHEAKAVGLVRS